MHDAQQGMDLDRIKAIFDEYKPKIEAIEADIADKQRESAVLSTPRGERS
jgi:hypothetical protein